MPQHGPFVCTFLVTKSASCNASDSNKGVKIGTGVCQQRSVWLLTYNLKNSPPCNRFMHCSFYQQLLSLLCAQSYINRSRQGAPRQMVSGVYTPATRGLEVFCKCLDLTMEISLDRGSERFDQSAPRRKSGMLRNKSWMCICLAFPA